MILNRQRVSVLLSAVVYAASLFVSPDILIHPKGCYHDFTIHSFDQLRVQGYLGKNVKSSNTCSFQYSKSDSWDASFMHWVRFQALCHLDVSSSEINIDAGNFKADILQILLFPFHSFW